MLKIKDNIDLKEIVDKYKLDNEYYEDDSGWRGGDTQYFNETDGVFICESNKEIFGIDNSNLDLLYDLIKANLVEKVGEEK